MEFADTNETADLNTPVGEVISMDFLEAEIGEDGYDAKAEPGAAGAIPPEGAYWFRFEWPSKEGSGDVNPATGLPNRWKAGATKVKKAGDVPKKYIGTSIKGRLLRPAAGNDLSLEEFDNLGLANRQFSRYISTMVMFGRTGLTDFLNSVLQERVAENTTKLALIQIAEEVMQQVPEGVGTIRHVAYYKDETDEKNPWKRLTDLNQAMKNKFKRGSKAFPKDEETGETLRSWKQDLGGEEFVDVVVFAELDNLLPWKSEEV